MTTKEAPKRLSDYEDEVFEGLSSPFVKAAALADMGEFVIRKYRERENRSFSKPRTDSCYTVVPVDGDHQGEELMLTLEQTEIRKRVGAIVNRVGDVGPVILTKQAVKGNTANSAWVFAEMRDGKIRVIGEQEAPDDSE